MTLTISVCWAEKTSAWCHRNSENIWYGFIISLLVVSPPVFIYSMLLQLGVVPDFFPDAYAGWWVIYASITATVLILSFIGSVIGIAASISILYDENKKKHWIVIKHCEESLKEIKKESNPHTEWMKDSKS